MSHADRQPKRPSPPSAATPCLCTALRRTSRAVTRLYDAELRGAGLRVTQYALLSLLSRSGEVRQGDLGEMACIDETTLTRSLRPLEKAGWIAMRPGSDRREKLVAITAAGKAKLQQARPPGRRPRSGCGGPCRARPGRPSSPHCPDVAQAASDG